MTETKEAVERWGKEKGILDKATPRSQFGKLLEEVTELHSALHNWDEKNIEEEIGDCVVVLTLLAKLCGMDVQDCFLSSYKKIAKRKGKMVGGVFVKEDEGDQR